MVSVPQQFARSYWNRMRGDVTVYGMQGCMEVIQGCCWTGDVVGLSGVFFSFFFATNEDQTRERMGGEGLIRGLSCWL